jgi:hypothetical protein
VTLTGSNGTTVLYGNSTAPIIFSNLAAGTYTVTVACYLCPISRQYASASTTVTIAQSTSSPCTSPNSNLVFNSAITSTAFLTYLNTHGYSANVSGNTVTAITTDIVINDQGNRV